MYHIFSWKMSVFMCTPVPCLLLSLVFGEGFLDAGKATLDLGFLGTISIGSTLAFDLGVYLVVIGLITMILTRDWAEEDGP